MEGTTRISVMLLGQCGAGKTSLIHSFMNNVFLEEYDPTIEQEFTKNISLEGITSCLQIIDTASNDEFHCPANIEYEWQRKKSTDAFILVYSITSRKSFEALHEAYNLIEKAKTTAWEKIPFYVTIVGTHLDMEEFREISFREAKELAKQWNCENCESSAKTSLNCDIPFESILRHHNEKLKSSSIPNTFEPSSRKCYIL